MVLLQKRRKNALLQALILLGACLPALAAEETLSRTPPVSDSIASPSWEFGPWFSQATRIALASHTRWIARGDAEICVQTLETSGFGWIAGRLGAGVALSGSVRSERVGDYRRELGDVDGVETMLMAEWSPLEAAGSVLGVQFVMPTGYRTKRMGGRIGLSLFSRLPDLPLFASFTWGAFSSDGWEPMKYPLETELDALCGWGVDAGPTLAFAVEGGAGATILDGGYEDHRYNLTGMIVWRLSGSFEVEAWGAMRISMGERSCLESGIRISFAV